MPEQNNNRRADDPRIEWLVESNKDIKMSLEKLADAVTKLAIIEERQQNDRAALERLALAVEKIDDRLDTLERAAPQQAQVATWVTSAVWAAAGIACVFVLNKLGIM